MSGASAAVLMLPRFGLSVRVESVALTYGGVGIEPGAIVVCKIQKETRLRRSKRTQTKRYAVEYTSSIAICHVLMC